MQIWFFPNLEIVPSSNVVVSQKIQTATIPLSIWMICALSWYSKTSIKTKLGKSKKLAKTWDDTKKLLNRISMAEHFKVEMWNKHPTSSLFKISSDKKSFHCSFTRFLCMYHKTQILRMQIVEVQILRETEVCQFGKFHIRMCAK